MKKLILIICLLSITVLQSFAQRSFIVIRWHGRYLQDASGRWHCLTGGGGGCIGREEMVHDSKSPNINALTGVNNGILEYDATANKWYVYISKDVLTNTETKANFKEGKIEGISPIVVGEDALMMIDAQKYKGKRLTSKSMTYTKSDESTSSRNEKSTEVKKYLKIELKDCVISN